MLVLAGAAAGLPGCKAGSRAGRDSGETTVRASRPGEIVLDGKFEDWPAKSAALADADWLYFRVSVEGQTAPLQASPETVAIWLDLDGDAKTGQAMQSPAPAAGMGVDAIVEFSPRNAEKGGTKRGAVAYAVDGAGARTELSHAQVGLCAQPTYGAPMYEVRVSRHVDAAAAPGLAKLLAGKGRGRAVFVLSDGAGKVEGWSDPEAFAIPAMAKQMQLAEAAIPAKAPGTVRVVSYNVLKSALMQNPSSFARVFQVLDPDIIIAEEWSADAATATSWFTATVTGQHGWNARSAAGDVVIVSQYPVEAFGPEGMTAPAADGKETPVRFVGAVVKTPAGDVAVGGMHLKCCGTAGSPEDARRVSEARAINGAFKSAQGGGGPGMVVLAGDLNLVGTRGPLDTLIAGLAPGGGDLTVAEPLVLGDAAAYTWSDPKTEFPDGRLDYVMFGGGKAVHAFVLDTARLSPKALARMGLDATDSAGSDHLPVVVDLKPGK